MAFEITIPTTPRRQAKIRYRHNTLSDSSSGLSSSSARSWPFHLILSPSSSSDDDAQGDTVMVMIRPATDRTACGATTESNVAYCNISAGLGDEGSGGGQIYHRSGGH